MTKPELDSVCKNAREYFESSSAGKYLEKLKKFPNGCCDVVSKYLGRFIYEDLTVQNTLLIAGGSRVYKGKEQWHAWLEVDGTRIDLTAEQFDDWNVASESEKERWHVQWSGACTYRPCEYLDVLTNPKHVNEYNAFEKHMLQSFSGSRGF